jgi:hypothetical protein
LLKLLQWHSQFADFETVGGSGDMRSSPDAACQGFLKGEGETEKLLVVGALFLGLEVEQMQIGEVFEADRLASNHRKYIP